MNKNSVSIRDLKGCIPALGRFISVEEMNEAIAEQGAQAGRIEGKTHDEK